MQDVFLWRMDIEVLLLVVFALHHLCCISYFNAMFSHADLSISLSKCALQLSAPEFYCWGSYFGW